MNDFVSLIKDFLEEFAVAYKYAELDFYKLKSEVVALMDKAKSKGFGLPDYCSMSISVKSRFETDVEIEAYYKKGNGKYHRFKKSLDLGSLTNIPNIVKKRLNTTGEVTIKLSDFANLYAVQEKDIVPTVEFRHLYGFSLKNAKDEPVRKELHIKDELFYYTVVLVYVYENEEKEIRVKHFGNIIDLPKEVVEKIASTEDKACCIDVTNQ